MSAVQTKDRQAVETILDRMGELAALPHVVFQVIEASGDASAPAAAIERAVTVDPGFAAKLLMEANSASFAGVAHVSSIREAVMRLGFGAVRNLALAVGTFDLFAGRTDVESLRRRAWWKTSVDVAMAAKWVAFRTRAAKPDDAYTAGLLHLVGKTLLDRCGGVPYTRVYELAKHRKESDSASEKNIYGAHFGVMGHAAATRWGFPPEIASAMNIVDDPEGPDTLRSVVAFAAWMVGESGEVPSWALENLGVSKDDLPTLLCEASQAMSSAQQTAETRTQPCPRTPAAGS